MDHSILYPIDVSIIKQSIPELAIFNDNVIQNLYGDFSTEIYLALWIDLNEEMIKEFKHWLFAEEY